MIRLRYIIILIALSVMGLQTVSMVFAADGELTASSSATVTPTPPPTIAPIPVLLQKIEQAKALLRRSPDLAFREQKKGKKYELIKKQIELAILDKTTGQIYQRRFWLQESDIKRSKATGTLDLQPVLLNDRFTITVLWWNSFNTTYSVNGDPSLIVIANKYLFPSEFVPDPKERFRGRYTDIVYVPFSAGLDNPLLVQAGKEYIDQIASQAYITLSKRNVRSRGATDRLVTDIVNKDFIKNIIVVEHVDPDAFRRADDGGKDLTDRVLAIIGANKDRAYSYTGSPAGASGISQFIKSTYTRLGQQYPSAGLIRDYQFGTAHHQNAMEAMVLFFDAHRKDIESKITQKATLDQIGGIPEEMLAAAYNGGPTRVIKSFNTYGTAWMSGQLEATLPKIFRNETLGYIRKFVAIKSLNLF